MHLISTLMPHPARIPSTAPSRTWDQTSHSWPTAPLCPLSFKSILMSSYLIESCFSYSLDPGKGEGMVSTYLKIGDKIKGQRNKYIKPIQTHLRALLAKTELYNLALP